MDKINQANGFVKIHRSILKWEWYSDIPAFRLFTHLLLTVNHKDEHWHGIVIKRGQRVTSYPQLSKEAGLTIKQIRGTLKRLVGTGEVAHEATSKYSIITVNNYDLYQTRAQPRAGKGQANGQSEGRQRATIEEYKEYKEIKKGAAPNVSPPADYEGMAWEDLPQEERARRLRR